MMDFVTNNERIRTVLRRIKMMYFAYLTPAFCSLQEYFIYHVDKGRVTGSKHYFL